jgi:hypothetical protein
LVERFQLFGDFGREGIALLGRIHRAIEEDFAGGVLHFQAATAVPQRETRGAIAIGDNNGRGGNRKRRAVFGGGGSGVFALSRGSGGRGLCGFGSVPFPIQVNEALEAGLEIFFDVAHAVPDSFFHFAKVGADIVGEVGECVGINRNRAAVKANGTVV